MILFYNCFYRSDIVATIRKAVVFHKYTNHTALFLQYESKYEITEWNTCYYLTNNTFIHRCILFDCFFFVVTMSMEHNLVLEHDIANVSEET